MSILRILKSLNQVNYFAWPLVAAIVYGALYFFADRFVYFPMKYPHGFRNVQGRLGAADVWLLTRDGVQIHGWLVRAAKALYASDELLGVTEITKRSQPPAHYN